MTTTTRTELGYMYRGTTPCSWNPTGAPDLAESLHLLQGYIARSPEYGNNPADYAIVVRTVTVETSEWVSVTKASALAS